MNEETNRTPTWYKRGARLGINLGVPLIETRVFPKAQPLASLCPRVLDLFMKLMATSS